MRNRHRASERPVRNIDVGTRQDALLICAAATIIVIRLQLWVTNYPKLGSGGLHIAHLLWGGVFMLVAIGMLVSFLGRGWRLAAAVLGAWGLALSSTSWASSSPRTTTTSSSRPPRSSTSCSSCCTSSGAGCRPAGGSRRQRTLELVRRCDAIASSPPGRLRRIRADLCERGSALTERRWFRLGLIWGLAIWAALTVVEAVLLVGGIGLKLGGAPNLVHALGRITIPDAAALGSSTVAATQVFVFVQSSLSATTAALALSPAATPLASVGKRVMIGAGGDRA